MKTFLTVFTYFSLFLLFATSSANCQSDSTTLINKYLELRDQRINYSQIINRLESEKPGAIDRLYNTVAESPLYSEYLIDVLYLNAHKYQEDPNRILAFASNFVLRKESSADDKILNGKSASMFFIYDILRPVYVDKMKKAGTYESFLKSTVTFFDDLQRKIDVNYEGDIKFLAKQDQENNSPKIGKWLIGLKREFLKLAINLYFVTEDEHFHKIVVDYTNCNVPVLERTADFLLSERYYTLWLNETRKLYDHGGIE
ncbi:MAG: hypothetical protein GC154_02525 [bacterium]|nr:hypothetical protein [bacterium]